MNMIDFISSQKHLKSHIYQEKAEKIKGDGVLIGEGK
jgi:hypothetical protein